MTRNAIDVADEHNAELLDTPQGFAMRIDANAQVVEREDRPRGPQRASRRVAISKLYSYVENNSTGMWTNTQADLMALRRLV